MNTSINDGDSMPQWCVQGNRGAEDDVDDIAALRVKDLTKYLPHTLLHDLSNQGAVNIANEEAISIFGFPGELAKHYQRKSTGQGGWAAFPHVTIQSVKDLSTAPEKLNAASDFVTDFDYPEDTCDPHGMSGCGARRIPNTSDGELWSAQRTQLLGIEIGHYETSNLLRFVHIERVIRLLATGD